MNEGRKAQALAVKALARKGFALPSRLRFPKVMGSLPTITSGAAATLPQVIHAAAGDSTYGLPGNVLQSTFTVSGTLARNTGRYLTPELTITDNLAATPGARGSITVSFWVHDSAFEFGIIAGTYGFIMKVDDEFVSLTATTAAALTYYKYDFGSTGWRRIDIMGGPDFNFEGLRLNEGGTAVPAERRGPRVLALVDSFAQGGVMGWPQIFGHAMGWDDVWTQGAGGTGWVATNGGAKKKLVDRIPSDVIAFAPDVVLIVGSINDGSATASVVQAEAAAGVAMIRAALPDCLVIGGYNAVGGIEKMTANALAVMDATRDGITSAGGLWANAIEMPLATSVTFATTTSLATLAARAGNTGVPTGGSTAVGLPVAVVSGSPVNMPQAGYFLEVGTGAVRERIRITGTFASGGRLYYLFDGALEYAHALGEPVKLVGPSYLTGQGRIGALTGFGNADTLVSSDAVHPSPAGHTALGITQAQVLRSVLASRATAARLSGPDFAA